jgi:hypothetical protein
MALQLIFKKLAEMKMAASCLQQFEAEFILDT